MTLLAERTAASAVPLTLEAATPAFLAFLEDAGAAPNTRAAYRVDLDSYLASVGPRRALRPIDEGTLSRPLVEAWLRGQAERGYAIATRDRRLACIRSLARYLVATGALGVDPLRGWRPPSARPARRPRIIGGRQIEALLADLPPVAACAHGASGTGPRERLRDLGALRLLVTTGARASELVAMDDDDVAAGYARIAAGTRAERLVPLDGPTADAIERYRREARAVLVSFRPDEPALLVNWRGERLSRQGLWLIVKGHARAAGLPAWVTPGTLRASLATRLLADRTAVPDVAAVLGHRNVATTQLYTRLVPA